MSGVLIVVPCYNEEQRLDTSRLAQFAATQFAANCNRVRFVLVNDGSRDGTLKLLEGLHQTNPASFHVLNLPRNVGKAEAVRQGMLWAFEQRPDYVGYWDADLATALEEIPEFCRVLDEHQRIEIVVGSRLPLLGRNIERRKVRRWLGRLFANVASLALRLGIYDTQCGAKMFRCSPATELVFGTPFLTRWIFDVEILARYAALHRSRGLPGLREILYERPLEAWRDVAGSKLRSRDFPLGLVEMGKIYWAYLGPLASWTGAKSAFPPGLENPDEWKRAA